jgi:hypothetical protein
MTDKQAEFLKVMPVGYMTPFSGDVIPEGFMEVNGQRLLKSPNMRLFNILRGVVVDDDVYFVLPTKQKVSTLFSGFDPEKSRIIMKVL